MTNARESDTRPYRRCVGALLINRQGLVFVGARSDSSEDAWQMPQGGLRKRETPEEAVFRELKEEIGTDKAAILAESGSWLSYDLPTEASYRKWKGRYRGQTQKWFALRFTGIDADIDLEASDHAEFRTWRWVPIDRLPGLIIPFKRPVYEAVVDEFRHLAVPQTDEMMAPSRDI